MDKIFICIFLLLFVGGCSCSHYLSRTSIDYVVKDNDIVISHVIIMNN